MKYQSPNIISRFQSLNKDLSSTVVFGSVAIPTFLGVAADTLAGSDEMAAIGLAAGAISAGLLSAVKNADKALSYARKRLFPEVHQEQLISLMGDLSSFLDKKWSMPSHEVDTAQRVVSRRVEVLTGLKVINEQIDLDSALERIEKMVYEEPLPLGQEVNNLDMSSVKP